MIVFETSIDAIVNVLPKSVDAKGTERFIQFGWGTIEELNKYLLLPSNRSKYPLIWLSTGKDKNNLREPNVTRRARLIFATRSANSSELNRYQFRNDFDVILQPVLDNFLYALSNSGISMYDNTDFETERLPNYSVEFSGESQTKQIAVWNAITLDATITINGSTNCLKQIFYNN
jgi:hypothetical protein